MLLRIVMQLDPRIRSFVAAPQRRLNVSYVHDASYHHFVVFIRTCSGFRGRRSCCCVACVLNVGAQVLGRSYVVMMHFVCNCLLSPSTALPLDVVSLGTNCRLCFVVVTAYVGVVFVAQNWLVAWTVEMDSVAICGTISVLQRICMCCGQNFIRIVTRTKFQSGSASRLVICALARHIIVLLDLLWCVQQFSRNAVCYFMALLTVPVQFDYLKRLVKWMLNCVLLKP